MKKLYIWSGVGIFIVFLAMLVLYLISQSTQPQKPAAPAKVETKQKVQEKDETKLSKQECEQIENILWIRNRLQFTDYADDINNNYPVYSSSCSQYPAQTAVWKPDKYWFLYNNYYFLAKDYYDIKDYQNAAPYYDKAIQEIQKSKSKLSESLAYWEGGLSYYYLEHYQKAKEYLLKAPQDILPIIMALGDIYYIEQDFKHSLLYYQRCIDFIEDAETRYPKDEYLAEKEQKCYERALVIESGLQRDQEMLN